MSRRARSTALVIGVGLLGGALLTCQRPTRHTYPVTADQLTRMGQIAGIAPCAQGPTIVAAVKRSRDGGGWVHVECPLGHREPGSAR